MAEKLRLGIIGMSEGNGHPYSWSAIFNGYSRKYMSDCPFPVIPRYLSEQTFPKDGLGHLAEVTHIWTQDAILSKNIASASKIKNVVTDMEDMIGLVDGVLLARDDADNHFKTALPFLKAGLPIFIDKPLALTIEEANKIYDSAKFPNQIFTCSATRFSQSFLLTKEDHKITGSIKHVEATIPKLWKTYAVHLIEPLVSQIHNRGKLLDVNKFNKQNSSIALVEWEDLSAYLHISGSLPSAMKIIYYGENGFIEKHFTDVFYSFKKSLEKFVLIINGKSDAIDRNETLEIIEIIERYDK